jgi:hypothetical protein
MTRRTTASRATPPTPDQPTTGDPARHSGCPDTVGSSKLTLAEASELAERALVVAVNRRDTLVSGHDLALAWPDVAPAGVEPPRRRHRSTGPRLRQAGIAAGRVFAVPAAGRRRRVYGPTDRPDLLGVGELTGEAQVTAILANLVHEVRSAVLPEAIAERFLPTHRPRRGGQASVKSIIRNALHRGVRAGSGRPRGAVLLHRPRGAHSRVVEHARSRRPPPVCGASDVHGNGKSSLHHWGHASLRGSPAPAASAGASQGGVGPHPHDLQARWVSPRGVGPR